MQLIQKSGFLQNRFLIHMAAQRSCRQFGSKNFCNTKLKVQLDVLEHWTNIQNGLIQLQRYVWRYYSRLESKKTTGSSQYWEERKIFSSKLPNCTEWYYPLRYHPRGKMLILETEIGTFFDYNQCWLFVGKLKNRSPGFPGFFDLVQN